jgi:Na+:H+ antiporter, NhaA family
MNDSRHGALPREAWAGIVLVLSAALAMILSNSPLAGWYQGLLDTRLSVMAGGHGISKPLFLWINDGLMAVFFFLIGLEIKREIMEGELSTSSKLMLPVVAAAGGMAVPAAIYSLFNQGDPVAVHGWAIPSATDIAFALGIASLLGRGVPPALRVFLAAVAVVDDLGAVVIIALFYTANLEFYMLVGAAVGVAVLIALNRAGVRSLAPYVIVGIAVWVCVLKSGVHATLAGVVTALFIPLRAGGDGRSPLKSSEHALRDWVGLGVVPMFAFANAGLSLQGVSLATLAAPVPLGIAAGLFLGKAIGVFGAGALAIRFLGAPLPAGSTWLQFLGVAILCGIGFTMSLFIGALAFEGQPDRYQLGVKLGVLGGSLLSATVGVALLLAVRPASGR